MIKLSSQSFQLKGISTEEFWTKLNGITVGQHMNPEISYTNAFDGNHDNVFGGRKKNNTFSLYLYRPIARGFRTEILAKGVVTTQNSSNELQIDCNYEIPFWSILMFLVFGGLIFLPAFAMSTTVGMVTTAIGVLIYGMIISSNHADMRKALNEQLRKLSSASKDS
ncbi:hypothetical protein [uncultured Sunxiuqinia sp.]|uniref:hypothetical protein n=1 Tax=uncultured Sunxiuqinia sp. TaxID=1573825 RepID=UPI0026207E4D|nr:hypothetical protein [uncultured Sunxiuqinia sp.]